MSQENGPLRGEHLIGVGIFGLALLLSFCMVPACKATPEQLQTNEYIRKLTQILMVPLAIVAMRAFSSQRQWNRERGEPTHVEELPGLISERPTISQNSGYVKFNPQIPGYVEFNPNIIAEYKALETGRCLNDVDNQPLPRSSRADEKEIKRDNKSSSVDEMIYLVRNSAKLESKTTHDPRLFSHAPVNRFSYTPVTQTTLLRRLEDARNVADEKQNAQYQARDDLTAFDGPEKLKLSNPRDVIAVTPEVFYAEMARLAQASRPTLEAKKTVTADTDDAVQEDEVVTNNGLG